MGIKSLIQQSIWKRNERDDFREAVKKYIYADYDKIPEGLSAAAGEAAAEIFSRQEEARGAGKDRKRARRTTPRLMKFSVSLTEKITDAEIDELDLCSRASNSVKRAGFRTVGDLLNAITVPDKISLVRQLGEKSQQDIFWQLFSFHFAALPQDMKKRYIRECAAMEDPPEENGAVPTAINPEGCAEKLLRADTGAFSCMDLTETENEATEALSAAGIEGSFLYPVYLSESMQNTDPGELVLSPRAFHILKRGGYNTLGEFLQDADITGTISVRSCGPRTSGEIFGRVFLRMYSLLSPEQRGDYIEKTAGINRLSEGAG